MAKLKRSKKRAAIGTWPTPEKVIGMPTKKGKVSASRGKYFLTVGRRRMEIPIGLVVSEREVRKLVGKEVHAVMFRSAVVALACFPKPKPKPWPPEPLPWPCYVILCYVGGPETIFKSVRAEIRQKLISKMVQEKIISKKLAQEIRRGLK